MSRCGLRSPHRPRQADASAWKLDVSFGPFWWVATTSGDNVVNVVEKRATVEDTGVSLRSYTNAETLQQHGTLFDFWKQVVEVAQG